MDAAVGDHFVIDGNKIGQSRRNGEVVEVLGFFVSSRPHFRVRWEDGHETIYVPGPGATLQRKQRTGAVSRQAQARAELR
jgi:Domain of unknown function (DUF1918)